MKQYQAPPKSVAKKPEAKPAELPTFEKKISDKITEKFGDKVAVTFVREDRVYTRKVIQDLPYLETLLIKYWRPWFIPMPRYPAVPLLINYK